LFIKINVLDGILQGRSTDSGKSKLERIDFSRIDLTEFIDEIMANIKLPDVSSFSYNAQGVVQQKLQNFYERGRQ
jgi:conjugal transfer mating pair stabilization protein TraN